MIITVAVFFSSASIEPNISLFLHVCRNLPVLSCVLAPAWRWIAVSPRLVLGLQSTLVTVMAVSITWEVLDKLYTVADLAKLAAMAGEPNKLDTALGSWLDLMGTSVTTPAIVIAARREAEYIDTVNGWTIKAGEGTRTPTVVERSQAALMGRAARLAGEVPDPVPKHTSSAIVSADSAPAATNTGAAKAKLTVICSQVDETDLFEGPDKHDVYIHI